MDRKNGGFAIASTKWVYHNGRNNQDVLLIRTDPSGNEISVRNYGGENNEHCYDFDLIPYGGFILAGCSGDEFAYYQDGHPSGPSDDWKAYLVKTDAHGNLLWDAVYPPGSMANNAAEFIALTRDGGYIIFTDTDSESPPAMNNFGFMKIGPDTVGQSK